MHSIAIKLRTLQLYAHAAHHEIAGIGFFGSHQFLGKIYPEYEEAYDAVVERMIGLGVSVDHRRLAMEAAESFPTSTDYFITLLQGESELRKLIDDELLEASTGTNNLLSQLSDDSEKRSYFMEQYEK